MMHPQATLNVRAEMSFRVAHSENDHAGGVLSGRGGMPICKQLIGLKIAKVGVGNVKTDGQAGAVFEEIEELSTNHAATVGHLLLITVEPRLAVVSIEPGAASVDLKHGHPFGVIVMRGGHAETRDQSGQQKFLKVIHA